MAQVNDFKTSWVEFFIEQRLRVQVQLAIEKRTLGKDTATKFEKLFQKLPGLLPHEPPALLHGDLWSGNLIANKKGDPCLIDPAVYFGHREAEIAFTKLFGVSGRVLRSLRIKISNSAGISGAFRSL